MKAVTLIGARPQFIKAAPLSRELLKRGHREVVVHSGQHYDFNLSEIFFRDLDYSASRRLTAGSGSHGAQTGAIMRDFESIVAEEAPDLIIVYGDTNTTLAGALVGAKLHVPVAHVEAGLRSFDRKMPEEINRVITDHLSDILFCPTGVAVDNLKREGIERNVHVVGDIMADTLMHYQSHAGDGMDILRELAVESGNYYLLTLHRAENTDDRAAMERIVDALARVEGDIIFPVHPRTKKALETHGLRERLEARKNIKMIDPVGYLDMLALERNARKIITDSGGIQKEAYIFKIPCVTLRPVTEWVETLEGGCNVLTGSDPALIQKAIIDDARPDFSKNHYGDGNAAVRIIDLLEHH